MSLNTWITILACGSGVWGMVVTFWPPATTKRKVLFLLFFVVLVIAGFWLVQIQFRRTEQASKDAEQASKGARDKLQASVESSASEITRLKQGLVALNGFFTGSSFDREKAAEAIHGLLSDGVIQLVDVVRLDRYPYIELGKPLGVHIQMRNSGVAPAQNFVSMSKAYIVEWQRNQDFVADDTVADSLFQRDLESYRRKYLSGEMKGAEVPPNQGLFSTSLTEPLDQLSYERIMKGRAHVYFFTWWAWENSRGVKSFGSNCRALALSAELGKPFTRLDEVTWHVCVTQNVTQVLHDKLPAKPPFPRSKR
jgi:hypothetical protein